MSLFKKPFTALALTAGVIASGFLGSGLFRDAQFARAEQKVQIAREQLQTTQDLAAAFNAVSEAVSPSVVKIDVTKSAQGQNVNMRRFFDREGMPFPFRDRFRMPPGNDQDGSNENENEGSEEFDMPDFFRQGSGSGVIVEASDGKAYILTNNHVAGDAEKMTITLADGREITNGKLLGADPKTDLAVLQVEIDNVIAAKLADSDEIKVGDWVLAFGSPLGYVGSMTHGIISALNRTSDPSGRNGILGQYGYENFIQTDAPINPGNSGGPLVNIRGEVVGINTAIASRTGGFQGIGFAIPSNQAKPIYEQLKSAGRVTRGYLGVGIQDVSRAREEAEQSGYTDKNGVLVNQVMAGTPSAGVLMPGDVITSLNGKPVENTRELRNQIALLAPGTDVKLGIVRDGDEEEVTVNLAEQPDGTSVARNDRGSSPRNRPNSAEAMGMTLADPSDEMAEQYGLSDVRTKGAIVTRVDGRSPAARAGIRTGDMITKVGKTPVSDADDVRKALSESQDKTVRLFITSREGTRIASLERQEE